MEEKQTFARELPSRIAERRGEEISEVVRAAYIATSFMTEVSIPNARECLAAKMRRPEPHSRDRLPAKEISDGNPGFCRQKRAHEL